MKKYTLEIFYYREDSKHKNDGMDTSPRLEEYAKETKILKLTTWESFRNEALRIEPTLAYIHVLHIENIETAEKDTVYVNKYETAMLTIKKSTIHGDGVFTKIEVPKGKRVISLEGQIISTKDTEEKYPKGEWNAIADGFFLCRKERTIYGFINHSREPNCKVDFSDFSVKTIKRVGKGEELLLDYREEKLPNEYLNGFGKTYL